jgi:hypothetical protein
VASINFPPIGRTKVFDRGTEQLVLADVNLGFKGERSERQGWLNTGFVGDGGSFTFATKVSKDMATPPYNTTA